MELNVKRIGLTRNPPLIILHGFLGSLENWKTFAKRLEKNFCVHLLDIRNHGQSPHTPDFSYMLMATDIGEYIEKNQLEGVTLLGHSMGGKVAMNLAKNYYHLIKNLIVIDISPRKYQIIQSKKIITIINQVNLEQFENRFAVKLFLEERLSDKIIINFIVKNIRMDGKQLQWKFNLDLFNKHLTNLGEEVKISNPIGVPTLFVKGDKSNFIRESDFYLIKEKFKRVRIITIPDCGHWVHYEKREELLLAIKQFLNLN